MDACLGDCDSDDECADHLLCFQRDANDIVPGCIGGAEYELGTDFCFERPPNYLWKFGNNGVPESAFPLGECEGDCDSDAE